MGATRSARDVTSLLVAWRQGEEGALDALMARVYDPLRRIAANRLRREAPVSPLETAALVNEAFLRLRAQRSVAWRDRVHFFSIAARVMRRILIDHARRQATLKRGGTTRRVALGDLDVPVPGDRIDLLVAEQAITALAARRPELAELVELRFFAGLTKHELATALGIAPATVTRRWRLARAWLYRYLAGEAIDVD